MCKFFRKLIAGHERHRRQMMRENLRSTFSVEERGGRIYITHEGIGVVRLGRDRSAAEIAGIIENARAAATELCGLDEPEEEL